MYLSSVARLKEETYLKLIIESYLFSLLFSGYARREVYAVKPEWKVGTSAAVETTALVDEVNPDCLLVENPGIGFRNGYLFLWES